MSADRAGADIMPTVKNIKAPASAALTISNSSFVLGICAL
jgi:hypothetical protein